MSPWWKAEGFPTAAEWSALFEGLTLLVAVVAAVIALRQLHAHFASERARSRPYVIVDYTFSSVLMRVEVRNISGSAATDLVATVDPPFESTNHDDAATLNAVFSPAERVSMLAPGRRIMYTLDRAPDYHAKKLTEKYNVTLTYGEAPPRFTRRWRDGFGKREVRYTDHYVLDFRQWSRAAAESDYENKNWNIATRQERRTESIVKAISSIAESLKPKPAGEDYELVPVEAEDVVQQRELTNEFELDSVQIAPSTPDQSVQADDLERDPPVNPRPPFPYHP